MNQAHRVERVETDESIAGDRRTDDDAQEFVDVGVDDDVSETIGGDVMECVNDLSAEVACFGELGIAQIDDTRLTTARQDTLSGQAGDFSQTCAGADINFEDAIDTAHQLGGDEGAVIPVPDDVDLYGVGSVTGIEPLSDHAIDTFTPEDGAGVLGIGGCANQKAEKKEHGGSR